MDIVIQLCEYSATKSRKCFRLSLIIHVLFNLTMKLTYIFMLPAYLHYGRY